MRRESSDFSRTFAVKSESPTETWRSHSEAFSPVRCIGSAAGVRVDYVRPPICQSQMAIESSVQPVSLGKLVHRVLEPETPKLTAQISFKETDETYQRLREIAARQRRPDAFVARAVFRIGLDALEKAIQGGLVS